MTKRSKKILLITIPSVLLIGGVLLFRIVTTGIAEFYSPMWHSESIAMARENGRLVSTPKLETSELRIGNFKFPVKEVWIEKKTKLNYKWFIFQQEITVGYRLMVTIEDLYPPQSEHYEDAIKARIGNRLMCNETIEIGGLGIMSAEVEPPFSTSVKLQFMSIEENNSQ